MSILPIQYAADGGITVSHNEHQADIPFTDIRFVRNAADDTPMPDTIRIICPVCGDESVHPVTGGAGNWRIQLLFIRIVRRRAVELNIPVAQRTFIAIKARIRLWIEQRNESFLLADIQSEDEPITIEAQLVKQRRGNKNG